MMVQHHVKFLRISSHFKVFELHCDVDKHQKKNVCQHDPFIVKRAKEKKCLQFAVFYLLSCHVKKKFHETRAKSEYTWCNELFVGKKNVCSFYRDLWIEMNKIAEINCQNKRKEIHRIFKQSLEFNECFDEIFNWAKFSAFPWKKPSTHSKVDQTADFDYNDEISVSSSSR